MEEVVLGSKKALINVKVGEQTFPVKKLKLGLQEEFQRELTSAAEKQEDSMEILYRWAEQVGIPAEVVKSEFDIDDLMELFKLLSYPKKK